MSLHTDKAMAKARSMGAYAGRPAAADLWALSKRELLEVALRLGELCAEDAESPASRVREEVACLREQGII